jgi:hypothetical protein
MVYTARQEQGWLLHLLIPLARNLKPHVPQTVAGVNNMKRAFPTILVSTFTMGMSRTVVTKVVPRLFTLSLLSLSLWMIAVSVANTRQTEQPIPIKVLKQLEPLGGVIPAEIRCGTARVNASNELVFNCKLKNNSAKKINAAGAVYSVMIERAGVVARDDHSSVFVNLSGPQFDGLDRATWPGEERSMGPSGPLAYDDAVIKEVEVSIDFVEFEDNLVFGEGSNSAQVVKDFREGAVKYRDWIKRKYEGGRKSASSIVLLVESEESLSPEIGLLNQNQVFGAKAYRRLLKKKSDVGGHAEIDKLLSQ